MKKLEDDNRRLTNEVVQLRAILEAITEILDGHEVSDFMLSFGAVRRIADLNERVDQLIVEVEKLHGQLQRAYHDR